jgi:hypothetical protein
MALRMHDKIDIYLKNPEYFQLDLINQKDIWMENVVRPLGSHYEASKRQIDTVLQIAEKRRKAQEARLAKIQMFQEIVIGVLFAGIDIIAASALKNVSLLSKKVSTQKELDTFIKSSSSFEEAFKKFSSQQTTLAEVIVANFDDKIKGLASTGTVQSAISTGKTLLTAVSEDTVAPPDSWQGPIQFQNNLDTKFTSICRKINESFVNAVRDSNANPDVKRMLITLFVHLPFVKPPTLSLSSFETIFANYFELCYWVRYIENTSKQPQPKGMGSFGLMEGFLADVVNERVLSMSGHHYTHTGGAKVSESNLSRKQDALLLGQLRNGDIRMVWDGYCSKLQANYGGTIIQASKSSGVDALFLAQGISAEQAYG